MTLRNISRLFALIALSSFALAQPPTPWRYDLHPGDRLTYAYTFRREVRNAEAETKVEAKFHTQVMIAAEHAGLLSAGFQRNRESADLLVYRIKGKDKLNEERPNFEKRMRDRPAQFSEAMEFTTAGDPQYSWETVRESASHLLPALHEIALLAPAAAKTGQRWHAMDLLGIEFEWMGNEQVHGKNCYRVKGTTSDGSVTLSYWWSPESGVIERIDLDGSYGIPGGTSHEQARMDLESRFEKESVSDWLSKSETRLGALEALLLFPSLAVTPGELTSILKSGNTAAQRLALAVAYQRGQPLPTAALNELNTSTNAEVKSLAIGMQNPAPPQPTTGLCSPPVPSKKPPPKFGTLFRVALTEKQGPGVPYFLRIPATYRGDRPVPLLIYLSGGAGLALDGVNTANDAIAGTDYLVLYPQAGDYWWKPEVAQRLDSALLDAMNEFNIDRDRVYIAGFSNGGTGALYMAELWPQRFAAVVSLMGAGQCNDEVQKSLSNLADLPVLFVHGEKDARVPAACSNATSDSLTALRPKIAPQLRLLPDRDHDLTLQSDDGLTLAFLKDKIREPFPKRVSFRMNDLTFPRQYWVELLEKKSGTAEVDAEIKKNNQLEIRSREVRRLLLHLRPEMFPQPGTVRISWNGKPVYEGIPQEVCTASAGSILSDPKLDISDRKDLSLP